MRRVESTEYADYPSPQFTLQFARFLFGLSYKATCKAGALPEGERGGGGVGWVLPYISYKSMCQYATQNSSHKTAT